MLCFFVVRVGVFMVDLVFFRGLIEVMVCFLIVIDRMIYYTLYPFLFIWSYIIEYYEYWWWKKNYPYFPRLLNFCLSVRNISTFEINQVMSIANRKGITSCGLWLNHFTGAGRIRIYRKEFIVGDIMVYGGGGYVSFDEYIKKKPLY